MDYTKQLKSDLLKSWDDCPPERDDAYQDGERRRTGVKRIFIFIRYHQAERQHRRIQKVYHADI